MQHFLVVWNSKYDFFMELITSTINQSVKADYHTMVFSVTLHPIDITNTEVIGGNLSYILISGIN